MASSEYDRTLAIAGVFQAAMLTQQLARQGYADETVLRASIRSILITSSVDTASVFGGVEGVRLGLETISQKMGNNVNPLDFELARYVLNMCQLESKLRRSNILSSKLGDKIDKAQHSADLSELGDDLFAELAAIYHDLISTMSPRIMVNGEQRFLGNPNIVNRIRSILLGGVRAAFLWGQLGGRRRHLVLMRKTHLRIAREILLTMDEDDDDDE